MVIKCCDVDNVIELTEDSKYYICPKCGKKYNLADVSLFNCLKAFDYNVESFFEDLLYDFDKGFKYDKIAYDQ